MPLTPRAIIEKWTFANPLRSLPYQLNPGTAGPLRRLRSRWPDIGRVYGSIGGLDVRLAGSRAEVRAAQRLRYQVFFEELSATPSMTAYMRRRDEDAYDPLCDHLLVVDRDAASAAETVTLENVTVYA